MPRAALPALPGPLAATVRPVPFGRHALVGAAWVRYEPGGVLHYRELLSAVLVHEGRRPRVSITEIWVDSVESRDGGRALWGIPKDLADLELRTSPGGGLVAAASTGPEPGDRPAPIGSASFRPGPRLPGRWPTPLSVAQALAGSVVRTPVRGSAGSAAGRRHLAGRGRRAAGLSRRAAAPAERHAHRLPAALRQHPPAATATWP